MNDLLKEIPKWLQIAAKRLLETDDLSDTAISELAGLCKQEANNEFPDIDCNIPVGAFDAHDSEEIRLSSISEIAGVNKLAPKKALEFGESNIAVVYGNNGSGKSSYVRLLKHVCGVRDCMRGQLHKNVFSKKDTDQKAKVSFYRNDRLENFEWIGTEVCDDLHSVNIFDTSFDQVFMGSKGEVSYEPPVLSFLSRLIYICDKVAEKINAEASALRSRMPGIPNDLHESTGKIWVEKLSFKTTTDEIESYCSFSTENETKLQELQERILVVSPADEAKKIRTKKIHADRLVQDFKIYLRKLSYENCGRIITARKQCVQKKLTAEKVAKNMFSDANLEGCGSDVWKELWSAARKYSEEVVYKGQEFPHIQGDSICVLCYQPLSAEAQKRFISFEEYIKDETQKQAIDAESEVKKLIDDLPDIPNTESLKTKIDASGIDDQDIIKGLNDTTAFLQDRKTKISSLNPEDDLRTVSQSPEWIKEIQKISKSYEDCAKKYDEDAKKGNRSGLEIELKNLKSKKWLAEQKKAIREEVNYLQESERLKKAKNQTNSQALSKKKRKLAEQLITEAFIQRFNNELKNLRVFQKNVKLIQSEVSKGKVLHTIQLDGVTQKLNEVLSEGENRIISIAAFLADVTGKNYPAPFVFDDPISSLDQNYEEAVVQRLCELASQRQVIIFTHRLSLLGMIQDYAKKASIEPDIICIRENSQGTGEPGDTPLFAKKPDKALNALIDKLRALRKLQEEEYESQAKATCSEFRILLERMVEYELMADVVHRYRRAINTMGKIGNLAKISKGDCEYFDRLMTKYSRFEHSHSIEAPVLLPKPDELETDFKRLQEWQKEFKNRCHQ